jgi:GT2 family glycosyltransferase
VSAFSAVILNWEEIDVVRESVERLVAEPDTEVIVVDNGSKDGSRSALTLTGVRCLLLEENFGQSTARNMGIACTRSPYVFLLDGDILYVPGSLETFRSVLVRHKELGCVGVHGAEANCDSRQEASQSFEEWTDLRTDFPMAWTQYGLFRRSVFSQCGFDETGYFGLPGHGHEDDDLYRQMRKAGYQSGYVGGLRYYHEKSTGIANLNKYHLPPNQREREAQFREKWS